MKYLITIILIALSLSSARADLAILEIKTNNTLKQFEVKLNSYTKTSTDELRVILNGTELPRFYAGPHRGYLYGPDKIGAQTWLGSSGGSGGGGNKNREGGTPEGRFEVRWTDSGNVTRSLSVNVAFLSGFIGFGGSFSGGYSLTSYSPTIASSTWSNNGVTNASQLFWPYAKSQ